MTPLRPSPSETPCERGAWRPLSLSVRGRLGVGLSVFDPWPVFEALTGFLAGILGRAQNPPAGRRPPVEN